MIKNHKKGFTLIELLVVVAIIGILSTFLTVNFIGARQRGRDATRKSDLRQIQIPLEGIRSDHGTYPLTADWPASCNVAFNYSSIEYIKKLPCDPSGTTYVNGGKYNYVSDGSTYTLSACLENTKDGDSNSVVGNSTDCPSGCASSTKCFKIQNF